jgi:hypothetical protein
MGERLVDLVLKGNFKVISVVGLSKNTGKTTALIYLIESLGAGHGRLALTSTGRDGEATDEITRKEKPRVTVTPGTLATTSERSLAESEALSVVRETAYLTAMGRIVIVRADRETRVILEGPATVAETGRLIESLIRDEGALRVVIDGSMDRIAVASPDVSEGIVLATGAILGPDVETVVKKTRHAAALFMTGKTKVALPLPPEADRWFAASVDGTAWEVEEGSAVTDPARVIGALAGGAKYLFVGGALSDGLVGALIEEGLYPVVIVPDATRLFVSERARELFRAAGGKIEVEREIKLVAITVNPHNPEGVDLDPVLLLKEMRRAIPAVPIFDVVREG